MDTETLKPILAGIARHALTTAGGMLVTDGVMQNSDVNGFVGAGMVILGVAWSWWNKRGQALMADQIKRLTATKVVMPEVKK